MIACCFFLGLGERREVLFGFRKTEKNHIVLYNTLLMPTQGTSRKGTLHLGNKLHWPSSWDHC